MRDSYGMTVCDTLEEMVDPRRVAVLAIDIQNDFCSPEGHFARNGRNIDMIREKLPTMRRFVVEARKLGLPIVLMRQCTDPGGSSDSPAWRRFKTRDGKTPFYTTVGTWGWQVDDGLEQAASDWTIDKYRPDAFVGTRIDRLLRANGIESVVILGTTTEGCIESTVRGASYHDYYTIVVRDAVATSSQVLHDGSMRLFEARYPLATADELLGIWTRATNARGKAA